MLPLVVITSTIVIGVLYVRGRRRNESVARELVRALESAFQPERAEYAMIGRGIGLGFDYHLSGPIPLVKGVLTLLPRYAILYLPIAYLLGRNDLLKLSFEVSDLAAGTGSIVHETAPRSRWSAIENDPDWNSRCIERDGRRYRLFTFNPLVDRRLEQLLDHVLPIETLNQITLDSRRNRITVFLTPVAETIHSDLSLLIGTVFSLTAPDKGFTVT